MASSDLMIKIDANIKGYKDKLKQIEDKTKNLEDTLASTAKKSGVAFAALTATVGLSIAAFDKQAQVQRQTETIIRATGGAAGLAASEVHKMASALQENSTYGDENIIRGQNLLLTFKNIGKDVFPEASQAMLDMSTVMGQDLKASAVQLGKALNDPIAGVSALGRTGVTFTAQQKEQIKVLQESGQLQAAQAIIMKELNSQFKGAAAAAAQGTGIFKQLSNTFGDLVEDVGKELAPAFIYAAQGLKKLLDFARANPIFAKMAAVFLLGGTALTGFVSVAATGALVFMKLKAAMMASAMATRIMSLGVKGLLGATGIGLLVVVLAEVAMNWEAIWTNMASFFEAFAQKIGKIGGGLGNIIKGIFTFDKEQIQKGWKDLQEGFSETLERTKEIKLQKQAEQAEASKAQMLAEKDSSAEAARAKDLEIAEQDAIAKEETELQKVERELARNDLDAQRHFELLERKKELTQKYHESEKKGADNLFKAKMAEMRKMADFENLTNQEKVAAQANTLNNLAALQNSSNSAMKAMGKSAAITQIGISTAQGAIAAYASLAPIPFIGPALGTAAAAMLTAYGVERAAKVAGLNEGGFVPGIGNHDSVPALLTPGELVVPKQVAPTFAEEMASREGGEAAEPTEITLKIKPESFMEWLEVEQVKRGNLSLASS